MPARATIALVVAMCLGCGARADDKPFALFLDYPLLAIDLGDSALQLTNTSDAAPSDSSADAPYRAPIDLAAGGSHTCARYADGTVQCRGADDHGQLGSGRVLSPWNEKVFSATPIRVVELANVMQLSAGDLHSCAVVSDGTVRCWGSNRSGQLGDGTMTSSATPVTVRGLSNVRSIAAGNTHSCAVLADRTAKCWGSGWLGDGASNGSLAPVVVSGLANVVEIEASLHTCARLASGSVLCWGPNTFGAVGDGTTTNRPLPTPIGITNALALSVGRHHSCALLDDRTVRCWGSNDSGQIGNGAFGAPVPSPHPVDLSGAVAISAGVFNSCAALVDGTATCWGWGYEGGNGDGTIAMRLTPVPVLMAADTRLTGVISIAQMRPACARMIDGPPRCWGNDGLSRSAYARLSSF